MSATSDSIPSRPATQPPGEPVIGSKRVLDPFDRVSEVLFGLIMVLTFTGSISVAEVGQASIRTTLLAALGCNLAWGIIDAILYLMGSLAEKGKALAALHAIRKATDPGKARKVIADALPPTIAAIVQPPELDTLRQRLQNLPEPPAVARLSREDWRGALGVFLLVFLSTFPVVIPFMCVSNVKLALRLSHLVAIGMLFLTGCAYGRTTGRRPWTVGVAMVILGVLLAAGTMALGG